MSPPLSGSLLEAACNWSADGDVLKDSFHSLTVPCNNTGSSFDTHLLSPPTFFTQTVRLSLSLCVLFIIAACFNCVTVLGRSIYSTATCSLYWIIVMALVALRSGLLMILLPVAANVNNDNPNSLSFASSNIIMGGFITVILVQSVVVYFLFLALDHEQLFRSPDFASADSPFHHGCISLTWRRLLCSWYRVAMAIVTLLPLAFLVAIEIEFAKSHHDRAPSPLVWVFVATLVLPRLCVLAMAGVLVFRARDKLRPTLAARLFLLAALLLSLLEEVPSSVIAAAPFRSCHDACILELTVYDVFQIFGAVSLIFYTFFVRSQYLRVEQECKLALVWDLQKLLQVNGRQDIVTH